MCKLRRVGWLSFFLLGLAGCGPTTQEFSGTVLVGDQPLPRGTLIIEQPSGNLVQCNVGEQGEFRLAAVEQGTLKLAVKIPDVLLEPAKAPKGTLTADEAKQQAAEGETLVREETIPAGFVMPIPIPDRYKSLGTSGLTHELTADPASWKMTLKLDPAS